MPKVAVIVNCYNAFPIMRQCLDALFNKSSENVFVVLVDNHSPDQKTRDCLLATYCDLSGLRNTVLDPGRNLGTHNGWNSGFEHRVIGKDFDYTCKLDDDTVITTPDWDRLMVAGLKARPDIAFLSADGTVSAKQIDNWSVETCPLDNGESDLQPLVFEIPPRNIVDFHCVMFRVSDMMKWERPKIGTSGDEYGGRVWLTNPEGDGDKRLYGGEELYMARKARAEGRKIAYFRNVFCNHLGKEHRCQDYQLWKFCYGIMRSTDKPVDEWRESGEMLRDLRQLVGLWAMKHEGWAKEYMVEVVRRIGDLGEERDAGALRLVAKGNPSGLGNYTPRTDMPEVIMECLKSAGVIDQRFKK